jgi:hypothetical protein
MPYYSGNIRLIAINSSKLLIYSSRESYRLCKKDYKTEEEIRAQQRAVEPLLNE